nr:porphobilinogen synthase [Deltaproteobacteria bacterium]
MYFPVYRGRRMRRTEQLRSLVRETALSVNDLILPLFVRFGANVRQPISSMPGHFQLSMDCMVEEARKARQLGINGVLLFGIPENKDPLGSEAYSHEGVIQQAVRQLKDTLPELVVITDVCLCEYTSHGHCGVISGQDVDNDATLELLCRMAVSHAEAGADIVAPSDMMDGRIGAIRASLDENGFPSVAIMSYAAKFASAFYGPFREAADSAPQFGDRKTYQMDPANSREALREVWLDVEEGADIVMVKPALPYLDV